MPIKNLLRVIYAPHRAFQEAMQNPKVIGPLLVMILFVAASTSAAYILLSKTYVESLMPDVAKPGTRDLWTESASFWSSESGVSIKENSMDYVAGAIYGNRSIEFSAEDSAEIAVQLDGIGQLDCSHPDGYNRLYFRVKWTSPEVKPISAIIYLYSGSTSNYFMHDLSPELATAGVWNNITLTLEDDGWISGGARWTEITGLKLELRWAEPSRATVLIDGVFFGGVFKPPAEVSMYLVNYAMLYFMQFVFRWILLSGIIYVMTRAFKANAVFRITLILVGFALITLFIQAIINAAAFSAVSTLKYPFEYIGGVKGESEAAYLQISGVWFINQVYRYTQMAIIIWTVVLCALIVRQTAGFSWSMCFLIAVVAYFAAVTVEGFLIGI
ncbi:MAG: hypothetical protein RMK50_02425 [Nitrososphaerota archaeon]|nr:hypothetical protein [Candidatus Bathyarchaeota archaeon]MDW8193666.1 hypothetical protein [Nitrososphaerota archaeon]